jgi:predicted kinase
MENLMTKLNFYMLIGIPAAGKSTWVWHFRQNNNYPADHCTISTDDVIENIACMYNIRYHECHNVLFQFADQQASRDLSEAVSKGLHIIWDQTNLTRKSRARKLRLIPAEQYNRIAVVFPMPEEQEWRRRLDSRPGKLIPEDVLQSMKDRYESPTLDEGFAEIRSAF